MNNKLKSSSLILWAGLSPFSLYLSSQAHSYSSYVILFLYALYPILLFAKDIVDFLFKQKKPTHSTKCYKPVAEKRRAGDRVTNNLPDVKKPHIDTWV